MEVHNNNLYTDLEKINEKYEQYGFTEIDFVSLFKLEPNTETETDTKYSLTDLSVIQNRIRKGYNKLALKYHKDKIGAKYDDFESFTKIKKCYIKNQYIHDQSFMNYINEIKEMLETAYNNEPETLIDLLNGNTEEILNKYNIPNSDFTSLKNRYIANSEFAYKPATEEQQRQFDENLAKLKIAESKIDEDELSLLIDNEIKKRDEIKIEQVFTDEQRSDKDFNKTFNETFEQFKDQQISSLDPYNSGAFEISPYNNYGSSSLISSSDIGPVGYNSMFMNSSSISMTNITDGYGIYNVSNKAFNTERANLTYEDILKQRKIEDEEIKMRLPKPKKLDNEA
jgi:hypothetical protein